MEHSSTGAFRRILRRARAWWQAGLLLAAVCDAAATGVAAFLLLALGDLVFVPGEAARQWMLRAGAGAIALAALAGVARVLFFRERDMARAADRRQDARRQTVFGAWELLRQRVGAAEETALRAFLVQTAAERGAARLQSLPVAARLPWPRIGRGLLALAVALALAAGAALTNATALRTALRRVLEPRADIPPYSTLVFQVIPDAPALLYGGSTNLLVEITGASVPGNVWLLTRTGGGDRVNRSVCFQESPTRFGQRIEQVVQPVEFCFATRRARSPWHRIELRLQPQIGLARLTVDPPAYSGLPREQGVAGREPLQALRGSRVTLSLASNRPLLDGRLCVHALDGSGDRAVGGRLDGRQSVVFEWTLEGAADLEVTIRDVQGTACRQPLQLTQQVRPDLPPVVTLSDPPLFAVATPSSRLPLAGSIEDDLGVRRAGLVRAVTGFRDRTEDLPLPPGGRRVDLRRELDLAALGVKPGETLEFYLDAMDSNPTLAGLGISEVATVRIIADEEYANMLRTRASMEFFGARFRLLAGQLEGFRQALRALKESEESGAPDEKQQAALDRARDEAHRTAILARRLAEDFQIYDMEKSLAAVIRERMDEFDRWDMELQQAQVGVTRLALTASRMLDSLGGAQTAVADQQKRADELEAAARVMWLAADFRSLLDRQRLLVRRLEAVEGSTRPGDREQLPGLGKRQEEIERQLDAFIRELRQRAEPLSPAFGDLRESSMKFAGDAEACGAASNMLNGVTAAANSRLREARVQAQEARDKLEALLARSCEAQPGCKNDFGNLCQGRMMGGAPENFRETLAQMLAGMLKNGARGGSETPGNAAGQGGGGGGDPRDGYWMPGSTPIDIPVYGPARADFSMPAAGGSAGVGQGRAGGAGAGTARSGPREKLGSADPTRARTGGYAPEMLPEKYREAVKRYFGGKE